MDGFQNDENKVTYLLIISDSHHGLHASRSTTFLSIYLDGLIAKVVDTYNVEKNRTKRHRLYVYFDKVCKGMQRFAVAKQLQI